jgi:hypothetical protein
VRKEQWRCRAHLVAPVSAHLVVQEAHLVGREHQERRTPAIPDSSLTLQVVQQLVNEFNKPWSILTLHHSKLNGGPFELSIILKLDPWDIFVECFKFLNIYKCLCTYTDPKYSADFLKKIGMQLIQSE